MSDIRTFGPLVVIPDKVKHINRILLEFQNKEFMKLYIPIETFFFPENVCPFF